MKLATIKNATADGRLIVVSVDGDRYLPSKNYQTMQQVIENWNDASRDLNSIADQLASGAGDSTAGLDYASPLPRAWQWLDGSVFASHGELMQKAFHMDPIDYDKPLMYQGMSHIFYGPSDDIPFVSEADGIDFEGEFGVIVDDVPMGVTPEEALSHIKLLVQINDWSLRTIAPVEMKTGFGWIQAKPACSMAPFAITPDEAGEAWKDGRLALELHTHWNESHFGHPNGEAMEVGFHDLIAHAAATRDLCAGTIIGSGTVSNDNFREVGSSCIAERRGMEIVDKGAPETAFMKFGDTVEMRTDCPEGTSLFGDFKQKVVQSQ